MQVNNTDRPGEVASAAVVEALAAVCATGGDVPDLVSDDDRPGDGEDERGFGTPRDWQQFCQSIAEGSATPLCVIDFPYTDAGTLNVQGGTSCVGPHTAGSVPPGEPGVDWMESTGCTLRLESQSTHGRMPANAMERYGDAASAEAVAAVAANCATDEGVPDCARGDNRPGDGNGSERSWCFGMPGVTTREAQVAEAMAAAGVEPSTTANHAAVFKVCLNKAVTAGLSDQERDALQVLHDVPY